jgi:hypothetical protein
MTGCATALAAAKAHKEIRTANLFMKTPGDIIRDGI